MLFLVEGKFTDYRHPSHQIHFGTSRIVEAEDVFTALAKFKESTHRKFLGHDVSFLSAEAHEIIT